MIKSVFKKNKISFICYTIVIGLFALSLILSIFPVPLLVEHSTLTRLYSPSALSALVFTTSIVLLFLFFFNQKEKASRILKIVCLIALACCFFCNILYNVVFTIKMTGKIDIVFVFGNISNILYFLSCILFLVGYIHKSKLISLIALLLSLLSFVFAIGYNIWAFETALKKSGYNFAPYLFSSIFSIEFPLFFIGFFFENTPPLCTKNDTEEIKNKLEAIKIRYEIGSITNEEYEAERLEILKNL